MSGIHISRGEIVVLYVDTNQLVIDENFRVVSGVRAELSDAGEHAALGEAEPKRGEVVSNSHYIKTVVRITGAKS